MSAFRSSIRLKFPYPNRNFFSVKSREKMQEKEQNTMDYYSNFTKCTIETECDTLKRWNAFMCYFFLFIAFNVECIVLFGSWSLLICLSTLQSGSVRAKLLVFELRKIKRIESDCMKKPNKIRNWKREQRCFANWDTLVGISGALLTMLLRFYRHELLKFGTKLCLAVMVFFANGLWLYKCERHF